MLTESKTICGEPISSLKPNSGKRIRYQCDRCKKYGETTYQSYNKAQKRRNYSGETFCQPCASHLNLWNGGIQWTDDGYKNIRVAKGKYKREHRLVMEKALGRPLSKSEIVHHIDEDKLNNSLDNLDLCKNKSEHQKAHHSLELIGLELFKAGLVRYDKKSHTYYVAHQKLRELLGHPEEGNQQPSPGSDPSEGSTTSSNGLSETMKDHERGALPDDSQIVKDLIAMGGDDIV
nr:hypothetical protein 6 [bacterium]